MQLFTDERGVSEVLGAILVFGLAVVLLVLVQALAVPAANERVEFDHNQRVQGDILGFQQNVDTSATQGSAQTATVEAGVRYPNRFFLLNPAPASGSVGTEASYFRIENARAVDSEVREYWHGGAKNYSSNAVRYRPNYNHYGTAPTTSLEHGLAYNSHPNANTTLVGTGSVVDGRRISLLAVDGRLSTTSSSTVALETEPLSAPSQSVSVEGDGGPITLHLRTGMTNATWTELLQDEDHVVSWDHDGDEITVTLESGVVYDLRMAEVGVGSRYTDEDPAYLASGGVSPRFVELGGNKLSVEVRDQYNTGEPGVNVTYQLEDGEGYFIDSQGAAAGDEITVTSAEDGRADVVFKPTSNGTVNISAKSEFDGDPSQFDENETVRFDDIAVVSGGGGGDSGSDINPYTDDSLLLKSARLVNNNINLNPDYVYVKFENNADSEKSIRKTRVNAYVPNTIAVNDQAQPTNATINGTVHPVAGPYVSDYSGGFETEISQGETVTFQFEFYEQDGDNWNVDEGDFFVFTIEFEDNSVARYFVVPDERSII